MYFSESSPLAIIACPGGKAFAQQINGHLKQLYNNRNEKRVKKLVKKYGKSEDEIRQKISFQQDLFSWSVHSGPSVTEYKVPDFMVDTKFTRFANGEFKAEIGRKIRGANVFIIQDVENATELTFADNKKYKLSVNDHIFCLFVTIDAAFHAGAKEVSVVAPVYPYSRQHKRKGREALTASRFGQIIEDMGVKRIITLDIHSREIENSFHTLHLENLHASYQILKMLLPHVELDEKKLVIVSPDTGAVDRNKFFAEAVKIPLAMLYKERDYSKVTQNASETNITSVKLLGDVEGRDVFMTDDMLATGGTLIKAMQVLKEHGAKRIFCGTSLPLFTEKALEHFDEAYKQGLFYRIIGTNAVFHGPVMAEKEWYISASISDLFARIILRIHHNRSVSSLLDNRQIIQDLISRFQEKKLPPHAKT